MAEARGRRVRELTAPRCSIATSKARGRARAGAHARTHARTRTHTHTLTAPRLSTATSKAEKALALLDGIVAALAPRGDFAREEDAGDEVESCAGDSGWARSSLPSSIRRNIGKDTRK